MSKSKTNNSVAMPQQPERKYSTQKILKSKALSGYQKDFAKVILKEKEYTIEGAIAALDSVLKGGR